MTNEDIIKLLHALHVAIKNPMYGLPLHSAVEVRKMVTVVREHVEASQPQEPLYRTIEGIEVKKVADDRVPDASETMTPTETERQQFMNFAESEFPFIDFSYLTNNEGFFFEFEEARILFKVWQASAKRVRVPDGFAIVPIAPTPEMLAAANAEESFLISDEYRAMINAAPKE